MNKCLLRVWVHQISSPLPACTPSGPAPSLAPVPTAVVLQHGKSLFRVPSFPPPYRRGEQLLSGGAGAVRHMNVCEVVEGVGKRMGSSAECGGGLKAAGFAGG